jgi:iron complex outermembrane recepter protein
MDQTVRSAFTEIHIPIVGAQNASAGMQRLELSVAGRFDDYSTFGSSVDPRVGLMWEPTEGIRFRGSYGTSYMAPRLADYSPGNNAAIAFTFVDPGAPGGISHQLHVQGSDADNFSAQESESYSFGIEFTPASVQGLELGLNYYAIEYSDRIITPPDGSIILGNPDSFGDLIIRNPTVAQVNEMIAFGLLGQGFFAFNPDFITPDTNFQPDSIDVIVDIRRRNMSAVKTSGLDISAQYGFGVAGGRVQLNLVATYIDELVQRISTDADPFDSVDTFFNPPDWRLRGSLGWQRQAWTANLFVNYSDSYTDNRSTIFVPVSSNTTLDVNVGYDFGERFDSGWLSGFTLRASAQNLFDKGPPRTAIVTSVRDMGFDPTNANPMGRLLAVEFMKNWGRR